MCMWSVCFGLDKNESKTWSSESPKISAATSQAVSQRSTTSAWAWRTCHTQATQKTHHGCLRKHLCSGTCNKRVPTTRELELCCQPLSCGHVTTT